MLVFGLASAVFPPVSGGAEVADAPSEPAVVPDVVYGHKSGMALTFDVFTPPETIEPNGAGVLFMVSGGWYSKWAEPRSMLRFLGPLVDRGFTCFAVRHGSSPKFGIPEAVGDVRRAVRFVRTNASRFGIDPGRIGAFGFSAGGHLSLMLGLDGEKGDPSADLPLERASSVLQAVVAVVAPTDLRVMVWEAPDHLPAYKNFPALDLPLDEAAEFSPLLHASSDDPPTLLIAGDADKLVPVSHSRWMRDALEAAGAEVKLVELVGAGHGFEGEDAKRSMRELAAWFTEHLAPGAGSQ